MLGRSSPTDAGATTGARTAPDSLEELRQRAESLCGRKLSEVVAEDAALTSGAVSLLTSTPEGSNLRRKGKLGQLVERVLGATGGSAQIPDFPELGVELKTIPVDADGQPRESTFVTSFSIGDADTASWANSAVRHKLSHVLWIPVLARPEGPLFGAPLFWRPTPEQEQVLRADFDDIMGMIAIGKIEELTARMGRWLQARPKAAHSRVRTRAYGSEGPLLALPRGFYLRARFTGALLRDPTTLAFAQ
jgi:DNA mismatch repair protein MutH